ncbi:hypothetical protein [Bdellovibrio svalbardensis]|uniref:Uncharacterized protein n=1 Tax=Bdellovibrio svalbardensis TaxID=2972972 RepID=A0ABT6DJS1_9BACT|nr:hypothetical protein [Bdellovibrio svalbardensis]MDG0817117.1 hypothetical protein [Bdellovibrio svalbardensis]
MKVLGILTTVFLLSIKSIAALPPQFSECLVGDSGTVSTQDLRAIAKVSKVTYCQNQLGLTNKSDTVDLLKDKNIQLGISLAKTNYSREDLVEMAKAGSFVLYVDSSKLAKEYLIDIAKAGAQLVIISATSGLSFSDLRDIGRAKSFVYNVNSGVVKEDLKALVDIGVQVVIRSNQSALSKEDIVEVAKVNSDLVSIMP